VGYTPVTFDPESTDAFGVGAFLLAGSEVRLLPQAAAQGSPTLIRHPAFQRDSATTSSKPSS